jgi:uncharacterized membrane protein
VFGIPLHRLLIHFPFALMIIVVIYDSWAVYSKRPALHETTYGLTLWSAVTIIAAVVSGLEVANNTGIPRGAVTGHAGYGIAAAIVVTTLGILRYSARARDQKDYSTVWLVLTWVAAGLVIATAVLGHRLN